MITIAKITTGQLLQLGWTREEVEAFGDLRSRTGSPDEAALKAAGVSAKSLRALADFLLKVGADAAGPDKKPDLSLLVRPDPASEVRRAFKLVINHTRRTDGEGTTVVRDLDGTADSRHAFHDVSLEHPISVAMRDRDGNVLDSFSFEPPVFRNEEPIPPRFRWLAGQKLEPNDGLLQFGDQVGGRLTFRTQQASVAKPAETIVADRFLRAGQYQVIGDATFRFDGYRLSFAVLDEATAKLAEAAASGAALGSAAAQPWSRSFAHSDPALLKLLSLVSMSRGDLDFEGNFTAQRRVADLKSAAGWMWVLVGDDVIAGYVVDPPLSEPLERLAIFLPARAGGGSKLKDVPYDYSETALLNRPDIFADDPGTACQPFDHPSRILSERRFWTVLRVTQPDVRDAARTPIEPRTDKDRPVDFPRQAVGGDNQIDYEGDLSRYQARSVTFGHVLEHRVRIRSNGYSLGDIAYSLTLAPRQKRRILKLDYRRREIARRTEETIATDEVADDLERERSYESAVASELSEWSRGKSSASAVAGGGGLGVVGMGPVVVGGGVVAGSADSASSQSGGREAAASESQQLREAIRRHGQALRALESTVVTESLESENIEAVSEVIQNINYTRALSVVYYEILRHLRVDTEIAGVSECMFVPMPILPWSDARISKHREVLKRYARGRYERAMFVHFDDVLDRFSESAIPLGIRAKQPLTQLSGSIFIKMAIEFPQDGPELSEVNRGTDPIARLLEAARIREEALAPFSALFPVPIRTIVDATLSASEADRDRYFQREVAPHMARRYLDTLVLEAGNGLTLAADFTLVGEYRFDEVVRVDFTVAVDGALDREMLQSITVRQRSSVRLPPRSRANVRSARINYASEHYAANAASDSGYRDLVRDTGHRDPEGALLTFALRAEDRVDFRAELTKAYLAFKKRLEAETFRYHKIVWRSLDADALYTLLDGYGFGNADGRSLASIAEHRLSAIMGNSLVFKTKTVKPLDPMFKTFADLRNHYVGTLPVADPMRISLPTDGLYARAHLDGCVAAEEHNGSFDWVFDNAEPDLADFPSDILRMRRAEPQGLQPTTFPGTIINLQNAPEAPGVNGLSGVLSSVTNPNSFRDMAGLAGTQANLQGALGSAAALAGGFGNLAANLRFAELDALVELAGGDAAGKRLKSFGAAVSKQVADGTMTPEAAKQRVDEFAGQLAGNGATAEGRQVSEAVFKAVTESPDGGAVISATRSGFLVAAKDPRTERDRVVEPSPGAAAPRGAIKVQLPFTTSLPALPPPGATPAQEPQQTDVERAARAELQRLTAPDANGAVSPGAQEKLAPLLLKWHVEAVKPGLLQAAGDDRVLRSALSGFFNWLGTVQTLGMDPGGGDPLDTAMQESILLVRAGLRNAVRLANERAATTNDWRYLRDALAWAGMAELSSFNEQQDRLSGQQVLDDFDLKIVLFDNQIPPTMAANDVRTIQVSAGLQISNNPPILGEPLDWSVSVDGGSAAPAAGSLGANPSFPLTLTRTDPQFTIKVRVEFKPDGLSVRALERTFTPALA